MPASCIPSIKLEENSITSSTLFEKALSPITLDVFSSTSNTGAKFKSMPTAMSSEEINHAVSAKISISFSSFA